MAGSHGAHAKPGHRATAPWGARTAGPRSRVPPLPGSPAPPPQHPFLVHVGGVLAPRWPYPQTRPPAEFSPSREGPLYPDSQTE